MTPDELAEYEVLKLANENGKFAVEYGAGLSGQQQIDALERMQLRREVILIDMSPLAAYPGKVFRVFLVTPEKLAWFRAQN